MNAYVKLLNINKKYTLILSYFLSIVVAIIVCLTGGTNKVYSNFMYFPIAMCSSTNTKKQRLFHSIFSGLLIGPCVPMSIPSNIAQEPCNWIIRLLIYVTVSFIIGHYSDYSKEEYAKLIVQEKELSKAHLSTIYALVKLTEYRDDSTGLHIERVGELCSFLAKKIGLIPKYKNYITKSYINSIHEASLLHDIGKVGISDLILLKPGKLTYEEYETMKSHSKIGADVLISLKNKYPDNDFIELGINIAYFHHEKWNGEGYPIGLSGEKIPLSARIMAIVDVYDALRSRRSYKEPYSHEKSISIIKDSSGSHFDPELVDVFIENQYEFKKIFDGFF